MTLVALGLLSGMVGLLWVVVDVVRADRCGKTARSRGLVDKPVAESTGRESKAA